MRVGIQTLGTRGDVQPYLALARELMRRGHEVQLSGPEQFESLAGSVGVAYASMPGEFLALLDTSEGKAAVAGGTGFSAGLKLLKRVRPLMARLLDQQWQAEQAFEPDVIVHHPKCFAAPSMAERLRISTILASPLPGFTPTGTFSSPMLPFSDLGPLNRASHALAIHGATWLFGKMLRQWRSDRLGLDQSPLPVSVGTLYAYSEKVVPKPPDWGEEIVVSGYWFLDEDEQWEMPAALSAFLQSGDAPIYVGFGSMPGIDPRELANMVAEGLALAGRRGVLATGGGALEMPSTPSHVHVIGSAPHDRILPLMSAALHHGGAGTTGASLRAGLPTIICPFMGDQPFWGRQVERLGVGPAALDRRTLDETKLAAAFARTAESDMRERARLLGDGIRTEQGARVAADTIERIVAAGRS